MKACDKIQLPDDVTMGYIAGKIISLIITSGILEYAFNTNVLMINASKLV